MCITNFQGCKNGFIAGKGGLRLSFFENTPIWPGVNSLTNTKVRFVTFAHLKNINIKKIFLDMTISS